MHSLLKTFSFAINGIRHGFRTQRNLRIQLLIFIVVSLGALLSGFSLREYIVILLCSTLVFVVEMLNTAIEILVDLVSPGWNEKAGLIKDVSAGAVLIVSIFSAIIGSLLFLRHFEIF